MLPIRFSHIVLLLLLLTGCEMPWRAERVARDEAVSLASPVTTPVATLAAEPSAEPTEPPAAPAPSVSASPPATLATATAERPPAPTATPAPSPTPAPRLVQLTEGGCCTQPFWSPDGSEVRFIDKPSASAPVGIWGVPVAEPLSAPRLVSERIGATARSGEFLIELGESVTTIERLSDGMRWEVDTQGSTPVLSPDGTRLAWEVRDRSLPFDDQVSTIWVAAVDGSGAQVVLTLPRGSVRGWLSEDRLLLSGRDTLDSAEQRLFTLSLADGSTSELVRSDRLRGEQLSPGRSWLVYFVAQSDDPAENGLWLVNTEGGTPRRLPSELFGAYQWRDDGHLLVIPLRPDATAHEVWEIEASSGAARPLTDPATLPFKIANGDWSVSPDGRAIAFVESRDRNVWVIGLGIGD